VTTDEPSGKRVGIMARVMEAHDELAARNRERFRAAGVVAIDVMGSPGAGKTALLEATLARLEGRLRCGVLVGDIATTNDADRLARSGVPVVQINTEFFGGSCHLEAGVVARFLGEMPLDELDLLFIENVGNLVCPAEFDIGQAARVVVLSVTEGEDKPLKYPLAFRGASQVVLSKVDLVPHLDVDLGAVRTYVDRVHPGLGMCTVSARTGEGLGAWMDWVEDQAAARGPLR